MTLGTSLAWFSEIVNMDMRSLDGSVFTGYFYSGSGTEDDPYTITRPSHYTNMIKLIEYNEEFESKYYKIGYDMDNDGDLEVFYYDNSGQTSGGYSDTLNMKAYPVNPIGTEEHPFKGNLDGSDLTISNLTVTSKGDADLGVFGYVEEDAYVHNIYFDGISIDTASITLDDVHEAAHCGYLAGHVVRAQSFENTYVNNCSLQGTPTVDIINDWGYYGCCENARSLEDFVARAKGEDAGWGGSVDMQAMYNRIEDIQRRATQSTIPVNEYYTNTDLNGAGTSTARIQTFKDDQIGSFVWYPYGNNDFSSNFNYLGGGIQSIENHYTTESKTGYRIHNGNNYVTNSGTTLNYTSYTGKAVNNAAVWTLSNAPANNNTTTISVSVKNGTTNRNYYIRYSNYSVSLSTTSYTWTFESNGTGFRLKNGNRYLRYNNGWTTTTTQRNGTTFTFEQGTFDYIVGLESSEYIYDYSGDLNTYFPLMTYEDYTVARKNTGYVISGSSYVNADYDFPIKSGDIRVSKYATSDISDSYNTRNKTLTNVYTVNSRGQRETITSTNSYTKYEESKSSFLQMISDGNIYGLHFMNGDISTDKLVTAPYALINGVEYENYELPADSIDFNTVEKGYINFFAGTYFSGNDSFFSLHEIFRDENNKITDIKEISEILSDDNPKHDYIYKYSDGTYSSNDRTGYTSVFNTSRIKKQSSLTTNAVYYFEIPTNAGEFALGSVDGGTGAYLMYLDIASNGGQDETITVDTFGSVEYRNAVDTVDNSICLITYRQPSGSDVSLKTNFEGDTYTITMTCSESIEVKVTLLSKAYKVKFNGSVIEDVIKITTFNI